MPRYVVQKHFRSKRDFHFDLMLEAEGRLVTFSASAPPDRTKALPCLVQQLADHPVRFLEFEGDLPQAGGWCRIHDQGTFEWIEPPEGASPPDEGRASLETADEVRIRLTGKKAKGVYQLTREPASGTDYWRFKKVTE